MLERPAAGAPEVTRIPYNERITVLDRTTEYEIYQGRSGRWLKAEWRGTTGWVFEACTGDTPRTAHRWAADPQGKDLLDSPSASGKVVCRTEGFAMLTVLEWQARQVTIDGNKGRWLKAGWKNKTGWIFEHSTTTYPLDPAMMKDFLVGRWSMDDPGKYVPGPPTGTLVLNANGTFDFSQLGGGVKGRWTWVKEFNILIITDAVSMGGTLTRPLPPQRFQLYGPDGYDKLELRNETEKPEMHLGTLWRVGGD